MTPKKAVRVIEKLQFAKSLLVIHGIITGSENEKIKGRLDKWAVKHGLRKKAGPIAGREE